MKPGQILAIVLWVFSAMLIVMALATYPIGYLGGPDSAQGFTVCLVGATLLGAIGWIGWRIDA